jgi:hypothetical protein
MRKDNAIHELISQNWKPQITDMSIKDIYLQILINLQCKNTVLIMLTLAHRIAYEATLCFDVPSDKLTRVGLAFRPIFLHKYAHFGSGPP